MTRLAAAARRASAAPRPLAAPALREALGAGSRWAWQLEARLVDLYEAVIREAYLGAARRLPAASHSPAGGLTAAEHAKWSIPDPDELGLNLKAQMDDRWKTGETDAVRVEAMRRATKAGLQLMNISFDTRNPLVEGVLTQLGGNIGIADTTRRDIMTSLDASWKTGLSIVNAAKALREQAASVAPSRARTIARTELLTAVNGGAHALASLSNDLGREIGQPPLLKIWLTAEDELVRDTHVDAGAEYGAGSGIPLDEPFLVGDSSMQYPGDQDGAADEVINCRCALSYEEGEKPLTASMEKTMDTLTYQGRELEPTGAVTASGVPVYRFASDLPSLVPPDAVPVGGNEPDSREWTAVLCLEGIPTSDGRMLGIDSVGWRELPLTLMAMLTSDHGGMGGAVAIVAGRIDAIEKIPTAQAISAGLLEDREEGYPPDAVAVIGRGVFDNSWDGDEVMRLVGDRTLRGISIDLAPERVELVELPPDPENPADLMGGYLEIVTLGEIMGATIVPFAAFAEAVIHVDTVGEEDAAEAQPVLAAMTSKRTLVVRVKAAIVAAGAPRAYQSVDYSDSSMIGCSPTAAECMALAQPGGQPAGDMHVTLAYLHEPDAVDFDALHKVVAGVAAAHDPIEGQVAGAGYFAPAPQGSEASAERAKASDGPESVTAAAPPVADAETPADSEDAPADGTAPTAAPAEAGPLHPHIALVDAPGLSKMRAALCSALDDAGIPYAQNHDFTPHITLGYEAEPGVPAAHLGGAPLTFGHLTVHQGATRTDHPMGSGDDAVTASAAGLAPLAPPAAWFENPELGEPTPLTVTDDGRIYGHLATWGSCHVGVRDACVEPPSSDLDYALFHLGHVLTEEGELVPVGTFTMDTGHADLALTLRATQAHYDNTGTAVADVRVGEDETGIWFAGAIRPDLSASKVRALRAAQISGDWRPHDGGREFCAGLAVNVPGFPVVRARTAIAASGQLLGLVAAGADLAPPLAGARQRVLELAERARPGYLDERRLALAERARA